MKRHNLFLYTLLLIQINTAAIAQEESSIYPADMQKNVLLELFTSQQCSSCPTAHESIEKAIAQAGVHTIVLAHHAGFINDFYSMTDDVELLGLFGNTTYNPAGCFDRMIIGKEKAPVIEVISISDDVKNLQLAAEETPYVSLKLETSYDTKSRDVTLTSYIYTHEAVPTEDVCISVWLKQDNLKSAQKGGSSKISNYTHHDVSRGAITDAWGDPITLITGQVATHKVTFNLPKIIVSDAYQGTNTNNEIATVLSDMSLVVFVHQRGENLTDQKIYNCAEVKIGESVTMGGYKEGSTTIEAIIRESASQDSHVRNILGQEVTSEYQGITIQHGKLRLIINQ